MTALTVSTRDGGGGKGEGKRILHINSFSDIKKANLGGGGVGVDRVASHPLLEKQNLQTWEEVVNIRLEIKANTG